MFCWRGFGCIGLHWGFVSACLGFGKELEGRFEMGKGRIWDREWVREEGGNGRERQTQYKPDYSPYTSLESTDTSVESPQLAHKDSKYPICPLRGNSNHLGWESMHRSLVLLRFCRSARMQSLVLVR